MQDDKVENIVDGSFNYVVTAQKSTSVTNSLVANFTSAGDINLIQVKSNRLEIYKCTKSGLQAVYDVGLYGRISTLKVFRAPGELKDSLFVSTECLQFSLLSYDESKHLIVTRAKGTLQDRIGRQTNLGTLAAIDPDCRAIGLHVYEGLFKVIPVTLPGGYLRDAFDIRLEELKVIDIQFLHNCNRQSLSAASSSTTTTTTSSSSSQGLPTIAVLHEDQRGQRHVTTYEINLSTKQFAPGPWHHPNAERGARFLIPLPFGGVLIVGEQTLTYRNASEQSIVQTYVERTLFQAFGGIDSDGSRWLLGDYEGNLSLVAFERRSNNTNTPVAGIRVERLGRTTSPSTISYLSDNVVFIGSRYGDCQLIRLLEDASPQTKSHVLILDTYTNLGPIVDFVVVDLQREGQGQIVSCSGAYNDGSLRVIRNGIGIEPYATINLPGVKGLFSLRDNANDQHDKYLLVTFINESTLLSFQPGSGAMKELGVCALEGFKQDQQTIHAANLFGAFIVQATSDAVYCLHTVQGQVDCWKLPTSRIVGCASYYNHVLVASSNKQLHLLEVSQDAGGFTHMRSITLPAEISCLDICEIGAVIGLWDVSVCLLQVPSLDIVRTHQLPGEILPRSCLIATLDKHQKRHHLLVATGEGHLYSFSLDDANNTLTLENEKKMSVGSQPPCLRAFTGPDQQQTHVFAASDRPTVIYSNNQKVLFSNVNLSNVSHMCSFNTTDFPNSLTVISQDQMIIGTIDAIQKLHIRSVPLGEMPRRIAHQPETSTLCITTLCSSTDPETHQPIEKNFVRLIDDNSFEVLSSFELEPTETSCSILSTILVESSSSSSSS
eukprot:CAMPEP_0201548474 /NCGR_PEP_ID=MMETSP0173_2-20130828/5023_1 /ASSEMBLY_ACC=CAM_ASM_000268 /TAXON_ID=218659 /ORGANISM="Vexillifera sp., Strain DIVA3 564/2" /LENGTH=830 /DNA_ID=CAMNT_0047957879 /DNA_START=56 /DNA_END=2544 /DNA_ORIENTATION=+